MMVASCSLLAHAFHNILYDINIYNSIRLTLIPSTKLDTCSSFHLVLKTPMRNSLPSSSPKLTSDSAARSADDVEDDRSATL